MVVDTSALLAILFQEPEAMALARVIRDDPVRLLSAVSQSEASIVVEARHGPHGGRDLDLLLHRAKIEVVAFDSKQAEVARSTWRKFGKGRHSARLNFGDCCSYALSKMSGEKLLFKGEDFPKTDVTPAREV